METTHMAPASLGQIKEKLTRLILACGGNPDEFSIGEEKKYCMNLIEENGYYNVYYESDGGEYSLQRYTNLKDAIYDFCTRFLSTEDAKEIAENFTA